MNIIKDDKQSFYPFFNVIFFKYPLLRKDYLIQKSNKDKKHIRFPIIFWIKVTTEGIWVQYPLENPVSNKVEPKTSWIKLHDGYLFGVGIYE